jgi:hypothetical protein
MHPKDAWLKVQAITDRLTYKPGTTLDTRLSDEFFVCITMRVPVYDIKPPHTQTTLIGEVRMNILTLERFDSEGTLHQYVVDRLRHSLQNLEMHECDEWLRLDGVSIFDPHRKDNIK